MKSKMYHKKGGFNSNPENLKNVVMKPYTLKGVTNLTSFLLKKFLN